MDKNKIDDFWLQRTKIKNPRIATNYVEDGRLSYDAALVSQYIKKNSRLLDLGAGSCTLSLKFLNDVKEIIAVDKFAEFLRLAPEHPKLKKVHASVTEYDSLEPFDIILLFGVVNFLNVEEELSLYHSCFNMLKDDGVFIVKNQCGQEQEVVIDSYSAALKSHYHARYPSVNDQRDKLSQYFNTRVIDIYPSDLNKWPNTHFYAFVSNKNNSK